MSRIERQRLLRQQKINEALSRHRAPKFRGIPAAAPKRTLSAEQLISERNQRERKIVRAVQTRPQLELSYKLRRWLDIEHDHYMGFGGCGDALLVMAVAWTNPRAKAIFFANTCSVRFIQQFFDVFSIPVFMYPNIMGQSRANLIYDQVCGHINFKQSAHLADGLYYGDWEHTDKYVARIPKSTEWKQALGTRKNHFGSRRTLVISISGSDRSTGRQRYLTTEEYHRICKKYADRGYAIYAVGSESDRRSVSPFPNKTTVWLTSDKAYLPDGHEQPHNLKTMLQYINAADEVISVDTWLKTYTLLAGIPTTVIKTRWSGQYREFGADCTDWIFLNPKIWPSLQMTEIESLF